MRAPLCRERGEPLVPRFKKRAADKDDGQVDELQGGWHLERSQSIWNREMFVDAELAASDEADDEGRRMRRPVGVWSLSAPPGLLKWKQQKTRGESGNAF